MPGARVLAPGIGFGELRSWQGNSLVLRVQAESWFDPLTEGVALGKLGEIISDGSTVEVEWQQDLRSLRQMAPDRRSFGMFDSLFGLALVAASRSLFDASGSSIREQLLNELWAKVQSQRGVAGGDKKAALVFRDPDYPIPACLQTVANRFPLRDRFRAAVFDETRKLGFSDGPFSSSEEEAITFLYEAARNSYEHARVNLQKKAVSGIRGVMLEKIFFASKGEIGRRSGLPSLLQEYCLRASQTVAHRFLFMSYTVADLGPGIQHTLPSLQGEDPWSRLGRAFRSGESRKPRGSDIHLGEGLPSLAGAAKRLRAFLFVRSAELAGYCDFSRADQSGLSLERYPDAENLGSVGTSLTLMWLVTPSGSDQGGLFDLV
jgi:hypothetical protein